MRIKTFLRAIGGYNLNIRSIEPGDPLSERVLILLHDALGSVNQWRDFPEILSRATKCRVVVYDRPLHGGSDPVKYDSIREQFDAEKELLHQLIHNLGIDCPGLIGVSDGATISLNYATSYSCDSIVAMAPHVIMEDKIMKGIKDWMKRREEFEEKLKFYHFDHTPFLVEQWLKLWRKADSDGWDMTTSLESVSCPVILIQDPEDPYGSMVQLDAIREKIPAAEIKLIEKAGHFPYVNFAEKVIASIKTVL